MVCVVYRVIRVVSLSVINNVTSVGVLHLLTYLLTILLCTSTFQLRLRLLTRLSLMQTDIKK